MRVLALLCLVVIAVFASSAEALNIKEMYRGCYRDKGDDRDLPALVAINKEMTLQMCVDLCKKHKFRYAGVQSAIGCRCGQIYGKHGRVGDGQCNAPCGGDSRLKCGAYDRNSVYVTHERLNYFQLSKGCYIDKGSDRDLSGANLPSNYMVPFMCIMFCQEKNFKFAGVQNSHDCFCGNSYGKYGKVRNLECNAKCKGNSKRTCGALDRNWVYTVPLSNEPVSVDRLYKGCYYDKETRDLPTFMGYEYFGIMKVEICIEMCKGKGNAYAALQNYGECRCGSKFGSYGKASDADCKNPCKGDKSQMCGGGWRNSVYATELS